MNNQPVEQMNHLVQADSELMKNDLMNSKHQTTKANGKTNGEPSIANNGDLQSTSGKKRFVNGQPTEDELDLKVKKSDYKHHSNHLDNSTTSYQNDSSVYYTPAYKVQHKDQPTSVHHKSLIEPPNTQTKRSKQHLKATNAMDCSFDNSIVPVASCSSMSSERSSLNSAKLYSAENPNNPNQYKKSTRRKDDQQPHKQSTHQSSRHHHHHRRQRNTNYHLESSNELPSALSEINSEKHNEFTSSQSGHFDHTKQPPLQNPTIDHQMIDHTNADGELIFDGFSGQNSPINTDDDSLPYFQTSSFNQDICNRLRWKLKYYFMNPVEKWKAKKKFPWKLLLQIIKIIFVTIHVLTYGSSISRFLNHQGNMLISFRELLLNNWDPVREVMAYPPSAGAYAVYTKEEFFSNFDFAVKNFAKITKQATGSFGYLTNNTDEVSPIEVCFKNYLNGSMDPAQFVYDYNNAIKRKCYILESMGPAGSDKWEQFSFANYLDNRSISLDFNRIIKVTLNFKLRTIYLNNLELGSYPECYDVRIKITYDNSQHSGQVLVDLKAKSFLRECKGMFVC